MVRVIIFTILGIAVFAGYSVLVWISGAVTHEKLVKGNGLAGLGGVAHLKKARQILQEVAHPTDLARANFVDQETTEEIDKWVKEYDTWREKK